jgi:hypothetical protein
MKKLYVAGLIILFTGIIGKLHAQVTTNGASGLAVSYGSLAAAINDLNVIGTVSASVVLTLEDVETAPVGGYVITATGTASFSITIDGGGNTVTAGLQTAGSTNDAVFKIVGGDYITVQNFIIAENPANSVLAVGTNTMTEFGIALYGTAALNNGAKSNTILNNTITLNALYTQSFGIMSSSTFVSTATVGGAAPLAQATTAGGENSDNKYYGNTISNVAFGMMLVAPSATATFRETGNDIGGYSAATGNTISFGNNSAIVVTYPSAQPVANPEKWGGITITNSIAVNVGYNTLASAITYTTNGNNGITLGYTGTAPAGFDFVNIINNNTITLNTSTNAGAATTNGIDFGYGLNGANSGILGADANNITINQTTAVAITAPAIAGIKAAYTTNTLVLTSNIITINQTTTSTYTIQSGLTGILAGGLASMQIPSATITGNSITFNQVHQGTGAAAITSPVNGIIAGAAPSSIGTADISTNTIKVKQSVTSSGTYGSGAINYISVAGGSAVNLSAFTSSLTISSNILNTLGSTILSTGVTTGINHDFTNVASLTISSNTINIDRTGAGTVYGT